MIDLIDKYQDIQLKNQNKTLFQSSVLIPNSFPFDLQTKFQKISFSNFYNYNTALTIEKQKDHFFDSKNKPYSLPFTQWAFHLHLLIEDLPDFYLDELKAFYFDQNKSILHLSSYVSIPFYFTFFSSDSFSKEEMIQKLLSEHSFSIFPLPSFESFFLFTPAQHLSFINEKTRQYESLNKSFLFLQDMNSALFYLIHSLLLSYQKENNHEV
jgi:hypothetical protein